MKRFYSTDITNDTALLTEQEAHHAMHVLRCNNGDAVEVVNGNGACWQGIIYSVGKREATIRELKLIEEIKENPQLLTLAIAPTKNTDRIEWAVEKITELGIKEIIITATSRTERSRINLNRLKSIVIAAMKQSGQLYLPAISGITPIADIWKYPASQHFLAYCGENNEQNLFNLACQPGKSVIIAIGPEGDFTEKEVSAAEQAGWQAVGLGQSRLRVETAAVYSAAVVKVLNGF